MSHMILCRTVVDSDVIDRFSSEGEAVVTIMDIDLWDVLFKTASRPASCSRRTIVLHNTDVAVDGARDEYRDTYDVIFVQMDLHDVIANIIEEISKPKLVIICGTRLVEAALQAPWCSVAHIPKADVDVDVVMCGDESAWCVWSSSSSSSFVTIVRADVSTMTVMPAMPAMSAHPESQYVSLVRSVLDRGESRPDRTGTGTLSLFGAPALHFDLSTGMFPLLTTKRVFWRGVVEELLWFLRGSTDARELADKRVHIWDANASREALDAAGLPDRVEGDLGPCFVAGTSVCTSTGMVPIERIIPGDVVLTHLGHMCPVMAVMQHRHTGDMTSIGVRGVPGMLTCTPEHPVYARLWGGFVDGISGGEATFVPASQLRPHVHAVGTKMIATEELATTMDQRPEFWWVMGAFVRSGWIASEIDGEHVYIVVPCDCESIVQAAYPDRSRLCQSSSSGERLYDLGLSTTALAAFHLLGHSDRAKHVPLFVHLAPRPLVAQFLRGLLMVALDIAERDGSYSDDFELTTASRELVLDLQRLLGKMGMVAQVSFDAHIRGVGAFTIRRGQGESFLEDGHLWHRVRHVETIHTQDTSVYNLSVLGDESYTVNTIAVHNCYGFQWRHFGATYVDAKTDYTGQGVDQIAEIVRLLRTDPTSRRILLSAWNPAAQRDMALPPCHVVCQFYVSNVSDERPTLSCHMYQRSVDIGLGLPFNIASYALLTCLLAHVVGMRRGEIIVTPGDAHIYVNHVAALRTQVTLSPRAFPKLDVIGISPRFPENIADLTLANFDLQGYTPHPAISMPLAT